tara:strand:- start:551 stop:793 length:243 start_codon:yes stop_codon:yes gene_type:complete
MRTSDLFLARKLPEKIKLSHTNTCCRVFFTWQSISISTIEGVTFRKKMENVCESFGARISDHPTLYFNSKRKAMISKFSE